MATVPQAAAAAAATAATETAAAETQAADTEAQTAQAILGDSTPGVNSKRGRCASPEENAVRKPKRKQGCASPGERAVLRLPLRWPQQRSATAAEAPAADTEAQTAQTADPSLALAIIGDATPGVNSKGGQCASPGKNAVREPKREQGCASPGECAVLYPPLMATVPQAAAATETEAQLEGAEPSLGPTEMEPAQGSEVATAAAPTAQKAGACLATAIPGDSTPGVSSKDGRCASPGENGSETAGKRTQTAPSRRRRREQQGLPIRHGTKSPGSVKQRIPAQSLPGSYTLIERTDNGIPSECALKMEDGCGTFTLPPPTPSGEKGDPPRSLEKLAGQTRASHHR